MEHVIIKIDSNVEELCRELTQFLQQCGLNEEKFDTTYAVSKMLTAKFTSVLILVETTIEMLEELSKEGADMACIFGHPMNKDMGLVVAFGVELGEGAIYVNQQGTC